MSSDPTHRKLKQGLPREMGLPGEKSLPGALGNPCCGPASAPIQESPAHTCWPALSSFIFPASPLTLRFLSLQEISKEGGHLVGGPQDNSQVSRDGFRRRTLRGVEKKREPQYLFASCSDSVSSDQD